MMRRAIIFFTIIFSIVAFGCSNDNGPFNQTVQGTVSVNPIVSDASISAKDADGNPVNLYGNPVSDDNGAFEVDIPINTAMPVTLSFTGGKLNKTENFEGVVKTIVESDQQEKVYATTLSTFIANSFEQTGDLDAAKAQAKDLVNSLLDTDDLQVDNSLDFFTTSPGEDAVNPLNGFKMKYANKAFALSLSRYNNAPLSSKTFSQALTKAAAQINENKETFTQQLKNEKEATVPQEIILDQIIQEGDLNPQNNDLIDQLPGSMSSQIHSIAETDFSLCIMHVNDTHSHIEATETSLYIDGEKTYLELGGFSRLQTKINDVRLMNPRTLFVHAGDAIQGTLYFTKFNGRADIDFLNTMHVDAMVVGNHEFDKGSQVLAQLVDEATFGILGTNVNASNEPLLSGKLFKSLIKEYPQGKVGIIGLVTPETSVISSPGDNITFDDVKTAAENEISKLKNQQINKIIVLSHMGYDEDVELANQVNDIDVIVGGHSHDLLGDYSSLGMNSPDSANPYPTEVNASTGKVCIVQSWEWAKALGILDVRFDSEGKILSCSGNAVLLAGDTFKQKDNDGIKQVVSNQKKQELLNAIKTNPKIDVVQEDSRILEKLAPYKSQIETLQTEVIGTIDEDLWHVRVPGSNHEASGEVLENGSYIAPVVCEGMLWKANDVGLDVDIVIQNAGGIRVDIPKGDLTVAKAYELLPFGNTLYILDLTGKEIVDSIQAAVNRSGGAFPYVAGARYMLQEGNVQNVEIKNQAGEWEVINEQSLYRLGTNNYIAGGGDAYTIFKNATAYRYDTGFVDVDIFMDYIEANTPIKRPASTGISVVDKIQSLIVKIIETTDIHGSLFPYDFIEDKNVNHSLAQVYTYVKEERAKPDQEVILLDNGDILQGQPIVNYYNFEVDLDATTHIVPAVMNYMQYDAGTVGNHDVEPGHAVYDKLVNQFQFPWLSANSARVDGVDDFDTYFEPYTMIEKQGIKIAVIGLTTPGIPNWLPQSLWSGMEFKDMIDSANMWVQRVKTNENPDLIVGLFHSGVDYTYNGGTAEMEKNENASRLVAENVPDFDIIFTGHDHTNWNTEFNGVKILGGNNAAVSVPTATITFTWDEEAQKYNKTITGEIVDTTTFAADQDLMNAFDDEIQTVKAYVSEQVGTFEKTITSRDAMFGDSAFVDLIHQLQFEISDNDLDPEGNGADISFCAPLQFDKTIEAGPVYIRDMYKLYKYENQLFLMEMTGQEIMDYLEFNYDKWMNQMQSEDDHLINYKITPSYNAETGQWSYESQTRYYNYDSAAGIKYTVDISKPSGQRVNIISMDNGSDFNLNTTYKVAINSYRGNGGGYHMTTGAHISDPSSRIIARTERDLRYYLIQSIREKGTVNPVAFGHWEVIPSEWAEKGMIKDYEVLYGIPTFAVFADPHMMDPSLIVNDGTAFQTYLAHDRKLLAESDAILKATVNAIIADKKIDFVIVPGDLTKDGAKVSHEKVATYLQDIENSGKKAYVICGNHDVNNPHAVSFDGENTNTVDTVSPAEFAQIYTQFGYSESLYRDPNSLSYIAEPSTNVWLFAIDSCKYGENIALGKPVTSGQIKAETLNWLTEKLAMAKTLGKQVIGMMHHGLLEHYTGQSQVVGLGDEYVVDNWETVSNTLASAGLSMVFTGHYHAQDVTSKTWNDDGLEYSLTDVETGSLVTYPNPYRIVRLQANNVADIQSFTIKSIDYNTNGIPFDQYSESFISTGLQQLAIYMATQPIDQGGFGMTLEQAEQIAPFVTEAFMAHYCGNENPSQETQTQLSYMLNDPQMKIWAQILLSIWTDLTPQDNNLIFDINKGVETVSNDKITGFASVSHYAVPDGVAEIIKCTPDGKTLIYTDASSAKIGFIDITDPSHPSLLTRVDISQEEDSEPTSVYISPDGKYAFVAIRKGDDLNNAKNGVVGVYDISDLQNINHVTDIPVGVGPDSLAVAKTSIDNDIQLQIIVAIEDEESDEEGDATLGGSRPGSIDVIQFNKDNPALSIVRTIDLVSALNDCSGVNYPNDPQPEYVAIHPSQTRAAITLQENNAVAIIDISDPENPELERIFSTGKVVRTNNADLLGDSEINPVDSFTGRREPDTIAYLESGFIVTANEGDTSYDTFGEQEYSGGRSFTIFDEFGNVMFDSGAQMEMQAIVYGHYPDERSHKRGIEVEGITTARLNGVDYVFPASERGSYVSVYRVANPMNPEFVCFLPTGIAPEGILAIGNRNDNNILLVTANEKDGTINIFQAQTNEYQPSPQEPVIISADTSIPWAALSGMTTDGTYIYAVPDNAFGESRIYRIDMSDVSKGQATIDQVIFLTDLEGNRISIDPEGIAYNNGDFIIVSESSVITQNEILFVNSTGIVQDRVQLPSNLVNTYGNPGKFGFEGVTVDSLGQYVYVALQRGFITTDNYARILRYDTQSQEWITARYFFDKTNANDSLWMGISEIVLVDDQTMLVLERDKGKGIEAEIKRVCSVDISNFDKENYGLTKRIIKDMVKDNNYLQEKAEGMTILNGNIWVVNDNDGANWTRLINIGAFE